MNWEIVNAAMLATGSPCLDRMTTQQAYEYLLSKTKELTMPDQPEPKYLHLRKHNTGATFCDRAGGITLAYIKEGHWYRVGASFCSLKDTYRKDGIVKQKDGSGKPVGRRLAKARLWTSPSWIHENDWTWDNIPRHLTTAEGRAWYQEALHDGMYMWWNLRPVGTYQPYSLAGPIRGRSWENIVWDEPVTVSIGGITYPAVDAEITVDPITKWTSN